MNRILFDKEETASFLPVSDFRALHLIKQLHVSPGCRVKVGIIGGKKGIACIRQVQSDGITMDYQWDEEPLPMLPITAVIAHPRPPSLCRLVKDLCSMGVSEMRFFISDTSPKSYRQSHVWKPGRIRKSLIEGASQAGETLLSRCVLFSSLKEALQRISQPSLLFRAGGDPLDMQGQHFPLCYIIGPERQWSIEEEDLLTSQKVVPVGLGQRILRTETASTAATALISSAFSARIQIQ